MAVGGPHPQEEGKEHITVCLCTFRRPELLRKLLASVSAQRTDGRFSVSVSVVDNDPELSGKPVADAFASDAANEIIYTHVPDKNLALLRNISLSHARGDYVAFIDDDEYPVDDWLSLLLKTLHEYRADGVLGPIVPEYLAPPPDWIVRGRLCERQRLSTGSRLSWRQTRTGNALLKRALFSDPANLFNLKNRLGAEDDSLFKKLMEQKKSFVWCDEAVVREQIPADRLTLTYFSKRSRLIGYMTYAYEQDGRSMSRRSLIFFKSCVAAGIDLALAPLFRVFGYHRYAKFMIKYQFHKAVVLTHLGRLRIERRDI